MNYNTPNVVGVVGTNLKLELNGLSYKKIKLHSILLLEFKKYYWI
ncbi:hypothetical protein [Spiroplasma turonicum]|nr:hypothetical protein [Spiroplasma turonicum]